MILLAAIIILIVVLYKKKVLLQENEIQTLSAQHQKQLLEASIRVQEMEREEIAKNIHDDLGAVMSVLRLNHIKAAKHPENTQVIKEVIEQNQQMLNEATGILKAISRQLAPPALMKLGFIRGIEELCKILRSTDEMKIDFIYDQPDIRFPHEMEVQLYRVTNELLNNILRHAKATVLHLELSTRKNQIRLVIRHNGEGISSSEIERILHSDEGLGIKSIHSRLQLIHAEIEYIYDQKNEAQILINVPL